MKNREIKKKVCPWLSGIYKYKTYCLGTKCAWITLTKRFGYPPNGDNQEVDSKDKDYIELLSPSELPKNDWEYECGLVSRSSNTQSVEM